MEQLVDALLSVLEPYAWSLGAAVGQALAVLLGIGLFVSLYQFLAQGSRGDLGAALRSGLNWARERQRGIEEAEDRADWERREREEDARFLRQWNRRRRRGRRAQRS